MNDNSNDRLLVVHRDKNMKMIGGVETKTNGGTITISDDDRYIDFCYYNKSTTSTLTKEQFAEYINNGYLQINKADNATQNFEIIEQPLNEALIDLDKRIGNGSNVDLTEYAKTADLNAHTSDTVKHITSAERTKWSKVDNKIDKTDITTTIDSTSTDTQVPSAKSIYYNCVEGIEINQTTIDTYGTEILKYPLGIWRINGDDLASKFTDLPVKTSGRIEITSIDPNINKNPLISSWSYRVYNFETYTGENYIRKIESGNTADDLNDTGWRKVCTTSVDDVPKKTDIVPADTAKFLNFAGNCNYCVKNGICYVSIWGVKIASTGNTIQTNVFLPKAANVRAGTLMAGSGDATCHALAYVLGETGELCFDVKDANVQLYGSFSYPVSES